MKLALAMIVKDEAETLAKTLESAKTVCDKLVIVDTGSTDDTLKIANSFDAVVFEAPFVDYSTTRNKALELAEAHSDWVLMLSGCEVLSEADGLRKFLEQSRCSAHEIEVRFNSDCHHVSTRLSRSGRGWRYQGVTHECLIGPEAVGPITPGYVRRLYSAKKAAGKVARWRNDIQLLEPLAKAGDPRSQFYLAQSYACLGENVAAVRWYDVRAENRDGWTEEQWEAKLRRAIMLKSVSDLLCAYDASGGSRAEPLYHAAKIAFTESRYAEANLYAKHAASLPLPQTRGFVDRDAYAWGCADLVAMTEWHLVNTSFEVGLRWAQAALVGYQHHHPDDNLGQLARLEGHVAWYGERASRAA